MEWLPLFKDQKLDEKLRREGIVKFKLNELTSVKRARDFLNQTLPNYDQNIGENFYGSVSLNDLDLKRKMHQGLAEIFSSELKSITQNHRLLTYFYLVKVAGKKSALNLHQDWSIIDERKYRAYNLWIPLSDSNIQNGTIYAIKGSQNFPLNIRGANIPPKFQAHFEAAKKHLKPFEVKLGEALIFDSRILHFSPPNQSNNPRTAVINNIIPEKAETFAFFGEQLDSDMQVKQYAVPEDLFIHYDDFPQQKDLPNPKGQLLGEVDYANLSPISASEFQSWISKYAVKKNWFQSVWR